MFTLEQIEQIKKLYFEGNSSRKIAKILNCSKFPILKVLKDIPKRKASEYKNHPCHNQFGKNNPNWKGGTKSVYDRIRALKEYWNWYHKILLRDNKICQNCGNTDNLQVHHKKTLKSLIMSYSKPISDLTEIDLKSEYFYNIDNGITYCKKCHKDWHKINGR